MHTPHDRFFHKVFSNPEHARGELQTILTPEISRRIDWSTLQALPARFIDESLAELRSDVLFSAKLEVQILSSVRGGPEHASTLGRQLILEAIGGVQRLLEIPSPSSAKLAKPVEEPAEHIVRADR